MYLQKFIDYLKYEKKYSPLTLKAYHKDLEEFLFFLEKYKLKVLKVTSKDIRNWIMILTERQLSERTINRKIAAIKSFYKFLLKTGTISGNPAAILSGMKVKRSVPVPFSEKEMFVLFDAEIFENSFEGLRDKAIISLLYTTGIRKAELINLKLHDIDFDKKELKVLGKRNKERLVPLLDNTLNHLVAYIKQREVLVNTNTAEPFLFLTKKRKKMYDVLVYRIINSYISKVSVKHKKSPHMLRHTFATHLLNNGAGLNAIKELLGHSSLAATQVYTHSSIKELQKIYNKAHPRNK